MRRIRFEIDFPGDAAAGLPAYSNEIDLYVRDDPGGSPHHFEEHIEEALSDWFGMARVRQVTWE